MPDSNSTPESDARSRLRVVGSTSDPPDGNDPPVLPQGERPGGFPLAWNVARVLIWLLVAVWMNPRLLDYVGGHDVARWILHHGWVRLAGALPVGVLALASLFEPLGGGRSAEVEDFARRVGGRTVTPTDFDPREGIPSGPGLRIPAGAWTIDVMSQALHGRRRTVARTVVKAGSAFGFAAHGSGRRLGVPESVRGGAMRHALNAAAERSGDPQVQVDARSFAWLADPPVALDHHALDGIVAVRTNQPDVARALMASGAVAESLAGLDGLVTRWSWTHFPDPRSGTAEMRLEWSGSMREAGPLQYAVTAMRTALATLGESGAIDT